MCREIWGHYLGHRDSYTLTHARTHAGTYARMHVRTHARTHARTTHAHTHVFTHARMHKLTCTLFGEYNFYRVMTNRLAARLIIRMLKAHCVEWGVATVDFPSPVVSINCILLRHFNLRHVLFHHIHKPPFWPSPFPLSWQFHPQHSSSNIPIIFPP